MNGNGQSATKGKAKEQVKTQQLVTFQLGADAFAAEVQSVERVLRYEPPNSVPDVPGWVEGVLEHRGQIIPIVDLRRRIELEECVITPETRILIVGTSEGVIGAVVDGVHEVVSIPLANIAPPPPLFRGLASEFVKGIAKVRDQLVVILDVDRVLACGDRIAFERALELDRAPELAVRG
jgi:purine-binding chemotaxis protein CheW